MLKKLYRTLGFALISCNLFFTPVIAYADSSVSVGTNMCFAIPGGLITGFVLVSMSRTKQKATKADKYIKSNLKLTGRNDTYLRTTTDKTKIKDD